MKWECLTAPDFEKAVIDCKGVGIIPVAVIEPHGPHLPLGTDMFESHWTACRAAEKEKAVVFPAYPYTINHGSDHLPGSIVIRLEVVFALLENICDEMARHGLTKIIFLSGHGGNKYFLPLFVQTLTEKDKAYTVYYADIPHFQGADKVLDTTETGHACEAETSTGLYINESLVKMDRVPVKPFSSLKRNKPLTDAGAYSPVDWYSQYPDMYVGDPSKGSAEKGKVMAEARVTAVANLIRAVKEDNVTPTLQAEFIAKKQKPSSPESWNKDD